MTQYSNTAEGGVTGTDVTVANSGGSSGAAWDVVNAASGELQYSNSQAMHGLLSYRYSSTNTPYLKKNFPSAVSAYAFRVYVYINSISNTVYLITPVNSSDTHRGIIALDTLKRLIIYNTPGTAQATFTTSLALNNWYRIEGSVSCATSSTGSITLKYFLGDSTSALETITLTNNNFGSADVAAIKYGTQFTATLDLWLDDIAENDTGVFIGLPTTNISFSRIFKWNIKSVLSLSRIFKWNVRIAVTPFTRTFKWSVIAGVLISRIFIWNTRQTITPVRIFKWNVRIPVMPFTRQFIWNTRVQVSFARTFVWNVIFKLLTSRIFVWNVRSILSTSRTFLWDYVGRVIIVRSLVWDVYAPWVANVKDCGPWTSINGNTVAWTPEQVNFTSWR